MFKSLMIIMKKEMRRVFTDKRLVVTNFILPMVSIALVYSLMGVMIQRTNSDIEAHVTNVIGANVPSVVAEMIEAGGQMALTIDNAMTSEQASELLLDGSYDYYLAFTPDFETAVQQFEGGLIPDITGLYSPKRDVSLNANYKMRGVLESYRQMILAERLGDANYLTVYNFNAAEIAIPEASKGMDRGIASMVPMLVSIFIFAGAMGIGMDSIAGEKERGTLATMLMTPVDRGVIIGGKILSLSVVAMFSMISSFVGVILSIPFSARFLSASGSFDLSEMTLGMGELGLFFVSMIGLVGMYVTIIAVLSMIANSLKEAGAYITPAYMVVMITAFMNMFGSSEAETYQYFIPIFNNLVNMKQILLGNGNAMYAFISLGTSLVVTLVLIVVARQLMHQEKVVFPS